MSAKLWKTSTSNAFSTTLNGTVNQGDTSITLTAVTGLQAPGVLCIDRVDSNGNATPTLREYISFTGISTNTLTGVTRGLGGSSDQGHTSGAIVEENFSISHWNDMVSFLQVSHDAAGSIITSTATITTARIITLLNVSGASMSGFTEEKLTLADNTTNDVTTSKHGFVPKAPNDTTKFLRGDATWTVPASGVVGADGWSSVSDSWSYASANTVTVPSGAASLYQVGDRVKFTQTTVKYFVITAVADTVLTFAVSTDYTVANAAISAIYYSHQENPIGYPGWFSYTPTGISASNVALTGAFAVFGRTCQVRMKIAFSGGITFTTMPTLPITAVSNITGTDIYPNGIGAYLDSGTSTNYNAISPAISSGALTVVQILTNAGAALSATTPITWANGDVLVIDFTYKI